MRTKMPGIGKAAVQMERCYSVHIHSLWDRAKRVGHWSSLIAATRWHKQARTREGGFDWLRPRLRSSVFACGQRCISAVPSAWRGSRKRCGILEKAVRIASRRYRGGDEVQELSAAFATM